MPPWPTTLGYAVLTLAMVCGAHDAAATQAETVQVSELPKMTHIHGLAVDPVDAEYLLIATHHGLFRAAPDGVATRVSVVQDFMGFTVRPNGTGELFASGHPVEGGNLGFLVSNDNGKTWKQVSSGLEGPVDFHQMTVSAADPNVIYGAYRTLQISRDGGDTWSEAGRLPERLIDLAASARHPDTLYAATEAGLLVSHDAGKKWEVLRDDAPVTMVEVTSEGHVYAFVYGQGLMSGEEGEQLAIVAEDFGDDFILHIAIDGVQPKRMFATNRHGQVLESNDGGKSWNAFGSQ